MTKKMSFTGRMYDFWFAPVSAAGFGMMRVGFGAIAFVTLFLEWPNAQRFYGPEGILPQAMVNSMVRNSWRFSLLDHVDTTGMQFLYAALLVSLFCVMIGLGRKWMLITAVVLLYSFHEYGMITLDGGDTLLRLIGFILLLSPCYRTFTIRNLRLRMQLVQGTGKDQPPSERTMPIWPYRLLLWQMIMIYTASALGKWGGNMWREGSAVAITLHLTDFTRLTPEMADRLSVFSPIIGYFTVFSQMAWILILLLGFLAFVGLGSPWFTNAFKRTLLLCGLLLHGAIFVLMDVGTFSLTVFVAYLGLLLDDDFRAIRQRFGSKRQVIVLYDGRCGFCKKSILLLSMLNWLHRLEFANFHDPKLKKRYAPDIDLKKLNAAMHVRLSSGTYRKGFFAFRALAWHLPAVWVLAPFLYVPGVSIVGSQAYAWIADHR